MKLADDPGNPAIRVTIDDNGILLAAGACVTIPAKLDGFRRRPRDLKTALGELRDRIIFVGADWKRPGNEIWESPCLRIGLGALWSVIGHEGRIRVGPP
jgi:hypothetical protein